MAKLIGNWFMSNFLNGTDASDEITGMGFRDILHGNGGADTIHGGGGDDDIFGDAGDDKLFGDEGDDMLRGGADDDTLDGGKGDDKLFGDGDQDKFVDVHGNNAIDGGSGFDTLDYSGFQNGRVTVTLSDSGSTGLAVRETHIATQNGSGYFLEDGRDTMVSIERVVGTSGDDTITGNNSANVLRGGAGQDVLTGGGGGDTFQFFAGDLSQNSGERITDFDTLDWIDLSAIDAQTNINGNNAFHVITGSGGFTGTSGELLIRSLGNGNFNVFGDTDGNGSADFSFAVHEMTAGAFNANDFLL
jgi:Ca2+-binding RTX toxin-like protein